MASDMLFLWGKECLSCSFCTDPGFHLGTEALCSTEEKSELFFFFLMHFQALRANSFSRGARVIISRKKEVIYEQVSTCLVATWLSISLICASEKKTAKVAPRSVTDCPFLLYFE